jgi:hypothetical protein
MMACSYMLALIFTKVIKWHGYQCKVVFGDIVYVHISTPLSHVAAAHAAAHGRWLSVGEFAPYCGALHLLSCLHQIAAG